MTTSNLDADAMTDGDAFLRSAVRRRAPVIRANLSPSLTPAVDPAVVADAVRAAAVGRLVDPDVAVSFIDDPAALVDPAGAVIPGAINRAIDELVAAKPYLGVNAAGDRMIRDAVHASRTGVPDDPVDPVRPPIPPAPQGTRAGPPLPAAHAAELELRTMLDDPTVDMTRDPRGGLWKTVTTPHSLF
jgi:hypothetical protein